MSYICHKCGVGYLPVRGPRPVVGPWGDGHSDAVCLVRLTEQRERLVQRMLDDGGQLTRKTEWIHEIEVRTARGEALDA